jgi:hypothetical protein
VEAVARAFAVPDGAIRIERLGHGHIHDTFLAEVAGGARRVVLQRLHTGIFREPERLMQNLVRVTAHLHAKLAREGAADRERRALTLVPARDGRSFHRDADGGFWRCTAFVERARALETAADPREAFEAARAFGRFAAALADLPGPPLFEVIPHFHDLPHRLAALEAALRDDPEGRARAVAEEAEAARAGAERVAGALARVGALPRRTVHNDCKLNNALLDETSGEGLCVIDLDTAMEGSVLADFGDLVRTAACPAAEDERDLSRVCVDAPLFEALAHGYLDGTGALLEPAERAALPLAGPLLALETGVRFLTDHVAGDVYFRIHRPDHNLDRARAQLRLASLLLASLPSLASRLPR